MLSTKLNVSLKLHNAALMCSCIIDNQCLDRKIHIQSVHSVYNLERKCIKNHVNYSSYTFNDNIFNDKQKVNINIPQSLTKLQYFIGMNISHPLSLPCRTVKSWNVQKESDTFGNLGGRTFERSKLDADEEEEEEFVENEVHVPRRLKPSPGQYAQMIKNCLNNKDLLSAINVLDIVKKNRDKPTTYMYNLLIRECAIQGELKGSFKLYNDMKKCALKPNLATYVSLLNACATSNDTKNAMDHLIKLREFFIEKNILINEAHYNAMIKAYSHHKYFNEAFMIADEMRDKKMSTDVVTFNNLFHAAVGDKNTGLRRAISIWQLMQRHRIKPNIWTYNLLLRCIRDCSLGDLKINDILIPGEKPCTICFKDDGKPDLLANPPVVSPLIFSISENVSTTDQENTWERENGFASNLPQSLTAQSNQSLDAIKSHNPLILFGGLQGILDHMKKDKVTPSISTFTLLLELVPNSPASEKMVINLAKSFDVKLDIDFYNTLIKKKSFRFEYDAAKAILHEIQKENLIPNIMTWGLLALGCHSVQDKMNLIVGIENTGYRLNAIIIGTLIKNACRGHQFEFIMDMMEKMIVHNIRPSEKIFEILDKFQHMITAAISAKKPKWADYPLFQTKVQKFNYKYTQWKEKVKETFPKERSSVIT
ncbi:pentatricopeptide repeat-containing protein 1, mitochondrial isoform X2 [Orussus abietinus]|uniref:pentatricopeptide repeat-containing protein 1, mitochondrial isoform X2 n=1 Tax=Orussus abietinus TaxID=222816 RepID=UPI000C71631D|nr:pentatricopeptide repeat-containing protein 1, mitochondrial isoform X2 [Orussus abietinus]